MDNPDGILAFWMSIIPLTSPIIMMARLPFGVESWELILSMFLLILGFILPLSLLEKYIEPVYSCTVRKYLIRSFGSGSPTKAKILKTPQKHPFLAYFR